MKKCLKSNLSKNGSGRVCSEGYKFPPVVVEILDFD